MQKQTFSFSFAKFDNYELDAEWRQMAELAQSVVPYAYAPYSRFRVAAVVMTDKGNLVTGTNQENSAYPSGMCAERTAVFYANSRYPSEAPVRLLILSSADGTSLNPYPVSPCGSCRQVLLETELRYARDIQILLYGSTSSLLIPSAKSLLPLCFSSDDLG